MVGLCIGGGLAALGYAISIASDQDIGGDIFVGICGLIAIICGILLCVRAHKNGTDYDKVTQGFVGGCCGGCIFIALLIVHLSLRFNVY